LPTQFVILIISRPILNFNLQLVKLPELYSGNAQSKREFGKGRVHLFQIYGML